MGAPLCSGSPQLMISTRTAPLLRLDTIARVARSSRVAGIDLDLPSWRIPQARRMTTFVNDHSVQIFSIWISGPARPMPWCASRDSQQLGRLMNITGARTLVISLPMMPAGTIPTSSIGKETEPFRKYLPPQSRIALALDHRHLQSGHAHLEQMTMLRRLAEEWGTDIALDIGMDNDPRWELEAAIMRLGSRLTLIRLAAQITSPEGRSGERISRRVVAAAVDSIVPPAIALAPPLLPWQRLSARACTDAITSSARYIDHRFKLTQNHAAPDLAPDFPTGTRA